MILASHRSRNNIKDSLLLGKPLFYLLVFFLPTQLGKHYWPTFSVVQGIRVDYLSPTIYFTDVLIVLLFLVWLLSQLKCLIGKGEVKKRIPPLPKEGSGRIFGPVMYALFVVFLIGNISLSGNFLNGLYHVIKFFEFSFVAYYLATVVKTKKTLAVITLLLSAGVVAESLLAIAQYVHQGSLGGLFYFFGERTFTSQTPGIANAAINGQLILRPYATFSHPNVLAGYLVVCLIHILFFVASHIQSVRQAQTVQNPEKTPGPPRGSMRIKGLQVSSFRLNREKGRVAAFKSVGKAFGRYEFVIIVALLLSLILGTIALFLTLSRVAIVLWTGVIVLSGFFWAFRFFWRKQQSLRDVSSRRPKGWNKLSFFGKHWSLLIGGVLSGLMVLLYFFFPPLPIRFSQTSLSEESVVQREVLIIASEKMVARSPLLGVGLGNFLPVLATIQKPLTLGVYLQPVHNIFLLIFAETGIVGLGIFLWFQAKTYNQLVISIRFSERQNYASRHFYTAFLVMLTSILILGLLDHYFLTLQQGQLLFAVVIGLCRVHIVK